MRFLFCLALIIAGTSTSAACRKGGNYPPPPPPPPPAPSPEPSPPAPDPEHYRMGVENGAGSCAAVIQELTFKNTIGCINCATDFCLDDQTVGLQEALKDESECKKILACLKVHGEECRCSA